MPTRDRTPATGDLSACAVDYERIAFDGREWRHLIAHEAHTIEPLTCPAPGCGWWPKGMIIDDEADWNETLALHAAIVVHDAEDELDALEIEALGVDPKQDGVD